MIAQNPTSELPDFMGNPRRIQYRGHIVNVRSLALIIEWACGPDTSRLASLHAVVCCAFERANSNRCTVHTTHSMSNDYGALSMSGRQMFAFTAGTVYA